MEPVNGLAAPCPLCGSIFTDDGSYASHLAEVHGLEDDDGAETTVEHALVVSGVAGDRALAAEAAEAAEAASIITGVNDGDPEAIHPSRIYEPDQDDHRWRPFAIGLSGVALLVAVGIGISGMGGDDDGPSQVAAGGASSTTIAGVPGSETTLAVDTLTTPVPLAGDATATTAAGGPPVGGGSSGATTTTRPVRADASPTTTRPPAGATPPPTAPPTTPPPTAPPTTAVPPTTARPRYSAPALSGARIESCQRSGPNATWTFSYVLSGGASWAPASAAQPVGGGRYREERTGRRNQGFPSSSIHVTDTTTGQNKSIALSPQLVGAPC